MEEIINIQPLDPNTFEFQEYSSNDTSLINSNTFETIFDPQKDHIEYFIYDLNNNILFSNEIGYPNYSIIDNQLSLEPVDNLKSQGYGEGEYNVLYNFFSNKLGSSVLNKYYIDEISSDRTEIRLNTTSIPNEEVISATNDFATQIQNSTGSYLDFYLNFGSNLLVIANNVLLDTSNPNDPTVLIKLYEPLPLEFSLKNECWVVEKIAESLAYNISSFISFSLEDENIKLKGPNFNINLKDQINNTTPYSSYTSLSKNTSTQGTGSYLYQINSLLAEKGIEINIDYTDYSDFIYLSSAQTRLENFYYKLALIETYQSSASLSSGTTTNYYVSSSNIIWQNKIDEIITNFDSYEYYLYYESGSKAWPKTNSFPPYINASTTSVTGLAFFTTQSLSASLYDDNNDNALVNTIPAYIKEDSDNSQYELFVEMLAQMFDNLYLYIENVTEKYNADNRLNYGISKDLITDVLRDLGIKIYQNNFSSNDLYSSLLGFTNSGSLFNIPDASTTLPTPIGLEYINTFVTASSTSSLSPVDDLNKEIYKRIYHNLPYLLKKKGTIEGLKTLITIYGIPDTVLRVNEFGGKDKNSNTYDFWQDEYNNAFYTSGSAYVSSSFVLNSTWGATSNNPQSIEFRFKTTGLPQNTSSIASQSLWETDQNIKLTLNYTGSGYTSGSYSGAIINPNNQYAKLDFTPDPSSPNTSASIYFPFYNGGWWSVLVNKDNNVYTLYAKNKNYNGEDGNIIGFQASSSVTSAATSWNDSTISYFGISSSLAGKIFTGSLQEIRYYTLPLLENNFDAYVMNPYSIESSENLAFRATLGGELYTSSISSHPKVTGSWITTSSFVGTSNFYLSGSYSWIKNTEVFYFDQFTAGIQNAISEKVKTENTVLPITSSIETNIPQNQILSSLSSIQQNYPISSSYTRDVDYVEVAFSPQNEINEDIMSTLGFLNIGNYIGDPREITSPAQSYPDLDNLRNSYFEKYTHNYNIWDYIRLIKYFDNSLFKMIQDWSPAKTSLTSGVIIKQHLLERNKYPVPQAEITQSEYTGSISMYATTGSSGGTVPELFGETSSLNYYSNITQSWTGFNTTPSGAVAFTQTNQNEFFDGEFSGSLININLDEEGYQPIIATLYSEPVLPLAPTVTFSSGSKYPIPYEIDYNKTYYLSFNYGNMTAGNFISIVDNRNKILYQSVNSPGSGSVITEIKEAFYPISFLTNNNFPPNISASNVLLQEYQLTNPSLDPLQNNATEGVLSTLYMDVDYSSNSILPVNSSSLYDGSATKFSIPDSNYTAYRNVTLRYEGSKTTSPNFNKPIYIQPSSIFLNNQYPVSTPSTESQVPNVSNYSNWFLYFDYIESAYPEVPNGGNIHGVYLVNTEAQIISLNELNNSIHLVSNIFPSNISASIIPAVYAAGEKNTSVSIIEGGANYQTICMLSGSTSGKASGSFDVFDKYDPSVVLVTSFYRTFFSTGSGTVGPGILSDLTDTDTDPVLGQSDAFLDALTSSPTGSFGNYKLRPGFNFYIYDTEKEELIGNTIPNSNAALYVDYTDTLFPLITGDIIRFGDARRSGSMSGSLDVSYNSLQRVQFGTIDSSENINSIPSVSASIANSILGGIYTGPTRYLNQNYRIFRRIPNETNIVASTLPSYKDPGFLVPENFNPNYDPYDLAKKAGIIS
jgi:hypothetical protein